MPVESSDRPDVTVLAYITSWCPDCTRSRRVLQQLSVEFSEIDIERTAGAEAAMRSVNGGNGRVPTIVIFGAAGQVVLVEPGDRELVDAVRDARDPTTGS